MTSDNPSDAAGSGNQQTPNPGPRPWNQTDAHSTTAPTSHPTAPPPQPGTPPPFAIPAPYPAQAPPAASKRKGGLIVLLVVAIMALAGAGGGAWYLMSGPSADAVLWTQPSYKGKQPPGESAKEVEGTWLWRQTVVQTLPDGVKAYDQATGKRVWATPLPGDSNTVCSAPPQSDGGIALVAYGDSKACDHLVAYDLTSGKQLWTKAFTRSKAQTDHPNSPTSTDSSGAWYARSGNVVIAGGFWGTRALKISDGSPAWNTDGTSNCSDMARYTGGKALIRVRACHTEPVGGEEYDEVSRIDPATGAATWTYTLHPQQGDFAAGMAVGGKVISTDPVVLLPKRSDMGLIALDTNTGKLRSTFAPNTPAKYLQSDGPDGTPWMEAGTFSNTFVIRASEGNNDQLLAAYNLDSGKLMWKTPSDQRKTYYPLPGFDGNKIVSYVRNSGQKKGPEIIEYDTKTGAPHTLVEYPLEVEESLDLFARPYWSNSRLYMTAIGSPQTFGETKTNAIVALTLHR